MDVADAGSRNGAPGGRFEVQQGVSGDRLLAWRGLAGPLRAPVPRRTGKMSARVGLQLPGAARSSRSRAPVWARHRERCAAWKLTHPDGAGSLAGLRFSAAGGSRNRAPEGRIRGSAGGIRRPPAREEGPCRAAESASSTPHRQDVGPGGAAAAGSGAVEPLPGACVGTAPRAVRRLEIDPPDGAGEPGRAEVQCCWRESEQSA